MMRIRMMKVLYMFPVLLVMLAQQVRAHCPLCTAGAAIAAGGAAYMGVDPVVIGLFIGAFGASTGWWVSNMVKKKFVPAQRGVLITLSFLLTMVPLLPILGESRPIYLSLFGAYGGLLNRTYILDVFLVGSIVGLLMVSAAPWISRKITAFRGGKHIAYQGMIITLALLIISGVALQFV